MEKFFNPQSIAIIGVTEKKKSIPRYILDNTQRWGYNGKIYGVTPGYGGQTVQGIPIFEGISDLPEIPDLAVLLIPAKYVPVVLEECGKFGIKRVAILSGGFNESGESGASLAEEVKSIASQYKIRFLGPNGLSVADGVSGVCLPFVPHQKMKRGGFSLISQSGGFFLVLWNMMRDENMGMARFVSIGNKLNVDECDMLEYLGSDPETKVIGMYLESIQNGERLVEVASKIDKPIIAIKANRSEAGSRAAMSHTASMSNNDSIVDAAFERAGIIRVEHINDLVTVARAFELPPMRGDRLMVMTPGGGSAVMMADLAEKNGFTFADPGKDFFEGLNRYTNAGGIIRFANPLDMGDIYDIHSYPEIIGDVLHSDGVDGAVYGHAWPLLPEDDDSIFKTMFHTDISEDVIHTMEAAGKPLAVSMSASTEVLRKMKHNLSYPIFDRVEDAIWALRKQADFHARRNAAKEEYAEPDDMMLDDMELYLQEKSGDVGEDMLFPLKSAGIDSPQTVVARNREEAVEVGGEMGFPVVMKVVSPDVLHKSDAGGVVIGVDSEVAAGEAYDGIMAGVKEYNPHARVDGIRVSAKAPEGHDMFIGGMRDDSFGPVVVFGYGGIYTEVFEDVERVLCPAGTSEIREKLERLKCHTILRGTRGKPGADIDALVDIIHRVSVIMKRFPCIRELDLNPVRVFESGEGVRALDARARIVHDAEEAEGETIREGAGDEQYLSCGS